MTYDPAEVEQALLVWLKRRGREKNIRAAYCEKVLPIAIQILQENREFVQPLVEKDFAAQTFFQKQFPELVSEEYKTRYQCSVSGWPTWAVERRRVLHLARSLAAIYVKYPELIPGV